MARMIYCLTWVPSINIGACYWCAVAPPQGDDYPYDDAACCGVRFVEDALIAMHDLCDGVGCVCVGVL